MKILIYSVTAVLAAAVPIEFGYAADPFDLDGAIQRASSAIGTQVEPHVFTDQHGRAVSIADYSGKPVVISLVFTSCPDFCPMVTQTLLNAVEAAEDVIGADAFQVLTVGFDTQVDTPKRMDAFARVMGVSQSNWAFLSADEANIAGLSADTGFIYQRTPWGFDHLALVTVLNSKGQVAHQIYGADFDSRALVEPLKSLVLGEKLSWTSIDGLINRVKLFCTVYDPSRDRYTLDYSIVISVVIGLMCLSGIAVFIIREWQRSTQAHR